MGHSQFLTPATIVSGLAASCKSGRWPTPAVSSVRCRQPKPAVIVWSDPSGQLRRQLGGGADVRTSTRRTGSLRRPDECGARACFQLPRGHLVLTTRPTRLTFAWRPGAAPLFIGSDSATHHEAAKRAMVVYHCCIWHGRRRWSVDGRLPERVAETGLTPQPYRDTRPSARPTGGLRVKWAGDLRVKGGVHSRDGRRSSTVELLIWLRGIRARMITARMQARRWQNRLMCPDEFGPADI